MVFRKSIWPPSYCPFILAIFSDVKKPRSAKAEHWAWGVTSVRRLVFANFQAIHDATEISPEPINARIRVQLAKLLLGNALAFPDDLYQRGKHTPSIGMDADRMLPAVGTHGRFSHIASPELARREPAGSPAGHVA
jgi:hypothetical protein